MTLTIDDIPTSVTPVPIRKDEVTYAANLAGGNPMQNYMDAQTEIASTGTSSLVEQEKQKWLQEQVDTNKKTVEELISDPTLPKETRRKIMETYVQGAIPIQNLREKFLLQTAIKDIATTVEDREDQTAYAEEVNQRDKEKQKEAFASSAVNGLSAIGDFLDPLGIGKGAVQTTGALASKILASIPIGIAAGFELMRTQDPDKATQVLQEIENWSYNPEGDVPQQALALIQEWMDIADVPFKWMGEQALKIPMGAVYSALAGKPEAFVKGEIGQEPSPELAAATYVGTSFVGYLGTAISATRVIKAVKGKPHIPTSSPLDTMETASKEQAGNASAKAIADNTGQIAEGLGTTKDQILNTYVLPKIEDEFGPIHPDGRVALAQLDTALKEIANETEISPHVYPVSQIIKERELYTKILTETERPHLLLSSSVLDIGPEAKLFGRAGKDYEALVSSGATKLEGTAVFGRNANHGYKTEVWANKYKAKLEESVSHLPDPGVFDILKKDNQFYVSWKFKREYNPMESLVFGDDTLSAHLFSKKADITDFANGTIGKHIFPAYMRFKDGEFPAQGAAAAREEARIESVFLREARDTFMKTNHPTELVTSLRKGEDAGLSWTAEDIAGQHPHLSRAQTDKLHYEYVAYRRIVDHTYNLSDRHFRKNLERNNMQSLYDENGDFITHTTEPVKELPDDVTRVWDFASKQVVKVDKSLPIVKLNSTITSGNHKLRYGVLPSKWQLGPIRAGALTKVPGYIPRSYKEWFIVEKTPKSLWIDGEKVPADQLKNHNETVAMAGTRGELDQLLERYSKEDTDNVYSSRKEEKDINDKIIHDSKVYDSYLKQIHRRGERLPSLDRLAEIEDPLVALTKTIRSVAKLTAWDDLNTVRRDSFIKAYGEFTKGRFPDHINEIRPPVNKLGEQVRLDAKGERDLLAAQSVFAQMEREQIASIQSDIIWKNGFHKIADIFEKTPVDAHILREWGEKGFIPLRTLKALGSNMWLYWRIPRMWVIQPQQFKELMAVSPSYAKHLHEMLPILQGLLSRTHTLGGLKSFADGAGTKMVKEYPEIIKALEESGIVQAVDMNQMIHGIWKDATKELDPAPIKGALGTVDKGLELTTRGLSFPGKVGRGLGYNPSELLNQISLWLFARHRWLEKNPGKNWNIPENRAQIARDQSLYSHMSSTRAGMYAWQEGTVSAFTQFVAIPWKSTLQMISSHQLTGAEKARLAGARLFWYGKYGIPLGAGIYKVLENQVEDKNDRETLAKYTESATNRIWNATLGFMADAADQDTKVDTKNLSTSIEGDFVWETIHTLIQMGKGETVEMPKVTFPYENASGSIMETVRTIYDIFQINQKGPQDLETWKAASWKAVSFAGTLSDFNKAMLVEGMSKSGNAIGYKQTRGEAIARLFGIPPMEETLINMANLSQIKRSKEVKNLAKQIHLRLNTVLEAKSVDEKVRQKEYLDGLASYLNGVPPYYKEEVTVEVFKLDRMSWREKKQSVLLNLWKNGNDERDHYYLEMRNMLEKSNDPEAKAVLKDLEALKDRGIK